MIMIDDFQQNTFARDQAAAERLGAASPIAYG